MLVICNDDLINRRLRKDGLQQFPCRAIVRVSYHHVQVLLEVGEFIDKQARVKFSGLEKTVVD